MMIVSFKILWKTLNLSTHKLLFSVNGMQPDLIASHKIAINVLIV